jgi:hypothetical protein
MRPTLRKRRLPIARFVWFVSVAAIAAGCQPPNGGISQEPPPAEPRTLDEILGAIDGNSARWKDPLWSSSLTATARFIDSEGDEKILNLEGTMLFDRPRRLRMDLRPGLGEQVMGAGSNDESYWIWIEPEMHLMKWGRHEHAGKPCADSMSIRPDQLACALGVGGLPQESDGLYGPVRQFGKRFDKLTYHATRPAIDHREYWIDRHPPHLVRVVVFRDGFGRIATSAYLDDYRRVGEEGPYVAHAVSIRWPLDQGSLTIQAARMAMIDRGQLSANAFTMPNRESLPPGVERIERVDADCDDPVTDDEPSPMN